MSSNSLIEWTEATWNPTLGCSKVSPGCKNCYAIRQVHRMAGNPNLKIQAANAGLTILQNHGSTINWTGKVRLIPERLQIPLHRRKPTTYFVNSLSDLFHEKLPDEAIDRIFAVMALCPEHTFQVLTKRERRLQEYTADPETRLRVALQIIDLARRICKPSRSVSMPLEHRPDSTESDPRFWAQWPLPNIWLGVSVENREQLKRVEYLRKTPAALRFLSCEPLLEDLGQIDLTGIGWVIVGGESGKGARAFEIDWARAIIGQCRAAGVPCFVKQLGRDPLWPRRVILLPPGRRSMGLKDKKGGNTEEWPPDLRVRQMPARACHA